MSLVAPTTLSAPKYGSVGSQNTVVSLEHKENIFFNFEHDILANGKECKRFGGLIEIQVSYKILSLEVPLKAPILCNPHCFQEGLF
jgi:hypothetical protein